MISLAVGIAMTVTANIELYCYKAHPNTPEACTWYVNDCIMDGEKPMWCLADYEQSIKEGR